MIRTLEAIAHAKVNLTLRVVGKRADGLHLLDSLTVFTEFGDHVRVTTGQAIDSIRVSGPFASRIDGDNIVSKALDRYRALTDTPGGLALEIEKNIPVAAGLGGGSSDVGAVLRILQEVVERPLSAETLNTLSVSIGADVPVCFSAQSMRMRGIGERLSPVGPIPQCRVLLVNPEVGLSAGQVFKAFQGPFSRPATIPETLSEEGAFLAFLGTDPGNDLVATAASLAPVIRDVLGYLGGLDGIRCIGMSGSGATCFGLFPAGNPRELSHAIEGASERGWWGTATTLLP